MIRALLVDVGGVLVMPDHELVGGIAADAGGAPEGADLDRGHYLGIAAGETAGGFDWDRYRRALLAAAGVPDERLAGASSILGRAMGAPALRVWRRVLPGATEGLAALAATGLPLAVVSNADGTVEELLADLGLAQVGPGPGTEVLAIVDSAVVGVAKPDPAIFSPALAATGVPAAETAYVGDTLSADVRGAERAGLVPLHLDPVGWCRDGGHGHVAALADAARPFPAARIPT